MLWQLRHAARRPATFKLNACAFLGRSLSLSSVEGPSHPPLINSTLGTYFAENVIEKHPHRPALICRGERPGSNGGPQSRNLGLSSHLAWDFAEFDTNITAVTRGLLRMGVKKGDRVGAIIPNLSAFATLQWACARMGAILVSLNPAYRMHEFVGTLQAAGVKHLFMVSSLRTSNYTSLFASTLPALRDSSPGNIQEPSLPDLRNLVVINNGTDSAGFERDLCGLKCAVDWRDVLAWQEDAQESKVMAEIARGLNKDDITNLIFTSGTTGPPKAATVTHDIFLNNALSQGGRLKLTHEDVVSNAPPLFHTMGLMIGNFAPWLRGAAVAYPSATFDATAVVNSLVGDKCTAMMGVPTHFHMALEEVVKREAAGERFDFSRMRTGINGGALVPAHMMKKLGERLNLTELTIIYGMTENCISYQTSMDDPIEKQTTTVGTVHPHYKVKLVDENGETVPIGQTGEVWTAGYALQKGYWNDEERTRAAMQRDSEGTLWMKSGDLGVMDEDGYLIISGRIKDLIIRGGQNLSPGQIDDVLMAHPAILEASAVAVPDEELGEVVGAWVVRREGHSLTKEEVCKCVSESCPQGKPAWVWFAGEDGLPDALPKTASGKIQKNVLRTWSQELVQQKGGSTSDRAPHVTPTPLPPPTTSSTKHRH
ncbi:acetyl-CoA synthetase-like protein [Athelia psychrophila]|uniref:Acetyl-CoA synthetase-like protein n=1 Tax=Athelia psychrophila TaxID=1759441 RepID=A0A166ENG6_9AGAM|nr:acetyl-CoA synthetase-like protein [Fibularhizoctonia sp. CBS 109695]